MISFTLEKKYRGEQKVLDTEVHMQRHRIGARGNATSFPLPWEQILRMLKDIDAGSEQAADVELPHVGEELGNWVQVLLKSSGADTAEDMSGLIHQARVRAEVVVELIEEMNSGYPVGNG